MKKLNTLKKEYLFYLIFILTGRLQVNALIELKS